MRDRRTMFPTERDEHEGITRRCDDPDLLLRVLICRLRRRGSLSRVTHLPAHASHCLHHPLEADHVFLLNKKKSDETVVPNEELFHHMGEEIGHVAPLPTMGKHEGTSRSSPLGRIEVGI